MSDDNDVSFSIDLDSEGFVSNTLNAQEAFESFLAAGEKISALIEAIESVGLVLAPVIITVLSLKEALNGVFSGEQIEAVNQQFEILTENAGIATNKLKEGMIEASNGMLTETEAIELTNKALVKLETGYENLPQLMDLARKAAAVMGGDVSTRFDQITQAIATGQTRMLRSVGIIVDQQKAYRDYANSIGVAAESLSKAGQQQAMMNAVLAQGQDKFGDIDANVRQTTTAWQQMKVAVSELGETIALITTKIVGESFKNGIQSFADQIKGIHGSLAVFFASEGEDKNRAKIASITDEISHLQHNIDEMVKSGRTVSYIGGDAVDNLGEAEAKVKSLTEQLVQLKGEVKSADKKDGESGDTSTAVKASMVDLEKQAAQQAKFTQDMAKLDTQLTTGKIKNMQSVDEATALYNKKHADDVATVDAQIAKIDAEGAKGQTMTRAQADAEILKLEELKKQKLIQDDAELRAMQKKSLDNYVEQSKTAAQGIERGFSAAGQKASIDMKDFGKIGTQVADSFSSHYTSAIQGMANGTKTATDAMEQMVGGMIGDIATNYGKLMISAAFAPPGFNPVMFAEGTALLALGGVLGSLGGGSSTSSSSSSTTSSSPTDSSSSSSSSTLSQAATQTKQQQSVSLVIQGNVLNNEQTARWITSAVRQAADATDFTVQSVGGGF